ncbi:MAG: GDP-mannose 4,6-dehydratase [bacterium]|nr:GDP-mannose 4,6-dehydratase [bacterium]
MSAVKTAFITGVTGQDGSYLAELLINKGYLVHGLTKTLSVNLKGLDLEFKGISSKLVLHSGDVSEKSTIYELIKKIKPDEVYHLATKHDLSDSLDNYLAIRSVDFDGTYFLLNAIKELKSSCKFFFASTSKVFGRVTSSPQNENTLFNPNSLYGISKVASMFLVEMFRNSYDMFACSGILYNHESPRRDQFFLPKKITNAAAKIKMGLEKELKLGDIEAKRDWGFAKDYVEAMWLMLQANRPEDYIIGTGEVHSVKDILEIAFGSLDLEWQKYVIIDEKYIRPKEDFETVADISKIKSDLNWEPKTKFEEMIILMVKSDLASFSNK